MLMNLAIGLPTVLVCLILQVAVTSEAFATMCGNQADAI